jgi:hypothetical protein
LVKPVFEVGWLAASSDKIRMEGVHVSSNCPERTAQMNPARNVVARPRLARMRIRMTDMCLKIER